MAQTEISIIIPTKNGGADIGNCLNAVFGQETNRSYEVIVIDSGSSDNTVSTVRKFPVTVIEIKPEDFGHGKTRNLGAEMAKGKYLVYLTQDAVPANRHWLDDLVNSLSDDKIAGAYSRWLPKEGCNPADAAIIDSLFLEILEVRSLTDPAWMARLGRASLFSNVSSCIRRSVWEKIHFNPRSIYGEDQEWAREALEAGYSIAYCPASVVYHSHNESLKKRFRNHFDFGMSPMGTGKFGMKLFSIPISAALAAYSTHKFMRRNRWTGNKAKWAAYAMAASVARSTGTWLGAHHNYIPIGLKRRFSTVPHMLESKRF